MRHITFRLVAAIALTGTAVTTLRADEAALVSSAPAADAALDTSWWLPDAMSPGRANRELDQLLGPHVDAGRHHPSSLIEQAERLLETPRPIPLFVGSPIQADAASPDDLVLQRNMFSHSWSDGAPLLLFDWSGKSGGTAGMKLDGVKRVADASTSTDWADLTSKVKLRERDRQLDPTAPNTWETDESLKLPVAGNLFVFGQLGASTPAVEQRQYKWLGKTGVGVKLKPWLLQEVQVRGGPAVRYDDTEKLSAGQSPERSELFLEAVTKVPLPVVGPVNLEYSGYAVPAPTPTDHNSVNQDLKLALPFSSGGQFHVGAKYKWEAATATPWMDRMEVYMGVQSKW